MVSREGRGGRICRNFFKNHQKKYFLFFCQNLSVPQSRAHEQLLRVHMTFPTSAEMKANMLVGWKEYWPIFITLIFTFLGWLAFSRNDGLFIQGIGAVGVIIFLPLFKMHKNMWFYVAAFFLGGAGEIWPEGTQWGTAFMGFEGLNIWTARTVIIPVQGAVTSFVLALLLYLCVFRLRGNAALLFKVPICMLFLLAAVAPVTFFLWLLIGLTGMLGPL